MTRPPHLLFASTLVTLAVSVAAATLPDQVNTKLGDREFTYRETVHKDNLWTISLGLMVAGDVSQNQVMAAILRRNPDAFQQGSMFYLRKGISLTIPSLNEIRQEDIAKADALFTHQEIAWKEGRPPESVALPLTNAEQLKPPTKKTNQESSGKADGVTTPFQSDQIPSGMTDSSTAPGNGIVYGLGFAAFLAGLYFLFNSRKNKTAAQPANSQISPAAPSSQEESPSKDSNMSSHNLSKKRDELLTTRQLVSDTTQNQHIKKTVSKFGNEAEMKLKIAKAYLELDRQDNARTMLEDVMVEGSSALRNKAKKLLGR